MNGGWAFRLYHQKALKGLTDEGESITPKSLNIQTRSQKRTSISRLSFELVMYPCNFLYDEKYLLAICTVLCPCNVILSVSFYLVAACYILTILFSFSIVAFPYNVSLV